MIRDLQKVTRECPKIKNSELAEMFGISPPTAAKYRKLSESEIASLDEPKVYNTQAHWYSPYSNILYKMARDGLGNRIMFLFLTKELEGIIKPKTIYNYLNYFLRRNFPKVSRLSSFDLYEMKWPENITVIKRKDLCKWIFANDLTQNQNSFLDLIKQEFPIVEEIYQIYHNFHSVLMGKDSKLLDDYLMVYEESLIQEFCINLKKDIAAVHQAISSGKNSGWVEGLNTKFKTIKRILYGRAKIVNLEKKFRLALYRFKEGECIRDLLKKPN